VTYGHRVLFGAAAIVVSSPATYLDQLSAAFVMADVELRRHTIRKALDRVCRTILEARWREDHALVDKMTHLTEWPSAIVGNFEPEFLALPEEVLVTVMRDHQNEFAVESKDGKLAPYFLAVLNTVADEAGEAVIRHGNERVLRARFNDARFFWEFDQRIPLTERVALLENVTFQKDLGSYAVKSARVRALAAQLGGLAVERGLTVDLEELATASRLAKTDLTTELVKEFTELQGEVGGLYARAQGFSAAVADSIYDHYRPTSMEDRIPATVEGQILAIADKADTIAGMFGLGMEPTGSKDPFALRRAANGIVKILAEGSLPLTLSDVASASQAPDSVGGFLLERLDFYLREAKGQAYDVVKAVLASGSDDVRDAISRAEAVTAVRGSQDFLAVSAAFKRMKNILAQAAEKGDVVSSAVGVQGAAVHEIEIDLLDAAQDVSARIKAHSGDERYVEGLRLIAGLRPLVDQYFDEVMVLVQEDEVRRNRLQLLSFIVASVRSIADLSEIVVAG
jgi:glycyl-tRNA synthetase beta chain